MAQCKQAPQEFIQSAFCPQVAVLCSNDAESLCQKNNLSFMELIQPFCRLTTEAHVRDPNNVPHTIRNLKIMVRDMNSQPAQLPLSRKMMNDAVSNAYPQNVEPLGRGNVIVVGDYDLQLSTSTPWFEAFRECFLQLMLPSDHEFLNHCLACMIVVSSSHPDPLSQFQTLSQQQHQQQHQSSGKLPKWFCPNILKYYVLIHDVVESEQAKAEAIYQSMKSTFGANVCHLLQINSRSLQTAETMKNDPTNIPDPWSQFLPKPVETDSSEYDASTGIFPDDSAFPSRVVEGTTNGENPIMQQSIEDATEVTEDSAASSSVQEVIDHPLALNNSVSANGRSAAEEPLSPLATGDLISASGGSGQSQYNKKVRDKSKTLAHGACLTISDHDRLRIFMHEFTVRALIPWAERTMRILNDQLTSRKGIHRSIFSVRKWLGGTKPTGGAAANQNTTVVYTVEAPELQMRRLGDLAFLFQMYEFAYQTYHTAKRDFNNDHAWLHYAGALEMACLAIFMQGMFSQKQYPHHYMESAITTYNTSCKNPVLATRATLVSSECLKSRGMYSETAAQFIRMTSEDSDLRSALLLEQAAHCFMNMKPPMVRKYAFHMILAGHRFSKAGQRKHALRSYSQALQVYKGKNWSLAEDHINFTLGRQSFNLKQLENAVAVFKHLLSPDSKQTGGQQSAFLREYLFVYKQLLSQNLGENSLFTCPLPELPLPVVDINSTKVLVCKPPAVKYGNKAPASSVYFDYDAVNNAHWVQLEEAAVASANQGSLPVTFRPTTQCFTQKTDNKYSPIGYVGEPVTIEIHLLNPLKITLVLSDIQLLWSFAPSMSGEFFGQDKPQVITNEIENVKNKISDEIITTQVIPEVILQGNEFKSIHLSLTPQQTGELRVVALAYNLGTGSQGSNVSVPGVEPLNAKPSFISGISVRGKQRLEVQGPRLNNSKEEKTSKVYGPDRRLDLVIQPRMPHLQVHFCDFPETLLCGEVRQTSLEVSNCGTCALHKLSVACSNPEFFTFGHHSKSESSDGQSVYEYINKSDINLESTAGCTVVERNCVKNVLDIPLPSGTLLAGSTVVVPMWIRGASVGGVHEVDFLFYYEPVETTAKLRHRVLRHTAVIYTSESLTVQAMALRTNESVKERSSDQSNVCLISCELENLATYAPLGELQICQVTCASSSWTIQHLSATSDTEISVKNKERMHLCLRGVRCHSSETEEKVKSSPVIFSNVTFGQEEINSSSTPCSDFYFRLFPPDGNSADSSLPNNPAASYYSPQTSETFKELDEAIKVDLTLIILWQAILSSPEGGVQTLVGQHHVIVDKINNPVTSYPQQKSSPELPPVKLIRDIEPPPSPKPSTEVTTQLTHYSFDHTSQIEHDFTKSRLCFVPVSMLIQNCSSVSVNVLVDTTKARERLQTEASSPMTSNPFYQLPGINSNTFSWAGGTVIEKRLEARETTELKLSACFPKPGIFNVNQLAVFVSYKEDFSEMILQKHSAPSVVTITNSPQR